MKQAMIDIGSNSMRLTLYETEGVGFKILFKEKIMAGLAGYVEQGILSQEGIECAYQGLLDFRETLESLDVQRVAVFATASLRNIRNTAEAVAAIKTVTGYDVEVISGQEEALFGYTGAMQEVSLTTGAFLDIGGASTEIVSFDRGAPLASVSLPIGSLNLYQQCVKRLLPGEGSLRRIQRAITQEMERNDLFSFGHCPALVCVGGTARAILKLARKRFELPRACQSVQREQLDELCDLLYRGERAASDLVLKVAPERIHTIVPGAMILQNLFQHFDTDEMIVSKYGVREGYLCQRVLQNSWNAMLTRKTGS